MALTSTFNYKQFYKLSDPFGKQALRLRLSEDSKWLDFATAVKLANGELSHTERVIQLVGYSGQKPMSLLWSGFSPVCCISEQTIALLTEESLTGWATYPVEVYDRDGQKLPNYAGLAITGRGGQAKPEMSSLEVIQPPWKDSTIEVYRGFYFDPDAWDGADIFLVSGGTVVTDKVRKAFKKAKVNNVRFTNLTEVETNPYLHRKLVERGS